ncbi:MAG: hypothetical protein EPO32_14820 [Anaerolineae bacterium]|nr:MAG: hypothetical protein EPO32_14820 [Anaerolineae bacterium]
MSKLESAEEFLEMMGCTVRYADVIELIRARDTAQFRAGAQAALDAVDNIPLGPMAGPVSEELFQLRRRIESGEWKP